MGGADDHPVGKREEFLVQALVQHLRHLAPAVLAGEIGSPDVARKECIAGKNHQGIVGDRAVTQQERYALNGVTRRLQDLNLERSELKRLPFPHRGAEPELLPRPVQDLRTGRASELPGAADIILVLVRLKDRRDLHVPAPGDVRIDLAVTPRIDDCRLAVRSDHV
ncbi:hypothetical protein DSECCO2_448880 [anaerobic digester metagenome]